LDFKLDYITFFIPLIRDCKYEKSNNSKILPNGKSVRCSYLQIDKEV